MNFIPARCPNCGGELMIPDDMKKIICSHCGTSFLLEQTQTQGPIPTVENWVKMAGAALESGNSKEALNYYNKILEVDVENWAAWFGKGKSIALESTIAVFTFDEMLLTFERALKLVPDEKKQDLLNMILTFSNQFLKSFSNHLQLHYAKYCRDANTINELINYDDKICKKIDILYGMAPESEINSTVIDLGVEIAAELLNGYEYADYSQNFTKYKLPQYFRDSWMAKYNKYLNIMKTLEPSYEPYTKLIESQKKECFIATATMGDYNHPYVLSLRSFRDKTLLTNTLGVKFVNFYYRNSPFFANIVAKSEILRKISLWLLIKPSAKFANRINKSLKN